MKPTQFNDYSHEELKACGRELITGLRDRVAELNQDPWRTGRRPWTELVLNWFAAACPDQDLCDTSAPPGGWEQEWAREAPRVRIDVRSRSARPGVRSEFLQMDQVHSTYPIYKGAYRSPEYWDDALRANRGLELRLALESEWKGETDRLAFADTLHSASKLASVRAQTKVLLFGSWKPGPQSPLTAPDNVLKYVDKIRKRTGDSAAPWLVIDLPWAAWGSHIRPRAWTAEAGSPDFIEVTCP